MMKKWRDASLTAKIMLAMVAGAVLGVLVNLFLADIAFVRATIVDGVLRVLGAIFVAALKMLVVPLVFVFLVSGVTGMGSTKALGRIGLKALVFYLFTTAVAVTIALSLAVAVSPGEGMNLQREQAPVAAKEAPALADVIIGMVPANPV